MKTPKGKIILSKRSKNLKNLKDFNLLNHKKFPTTMSKGQGEEKINKFNFLLKIILLQVNKHTLKEISEEDLPKMHILKTT